jgi:HSP20 family protein
VIVSGLLRRASGEVEPRGVSDQLDRVFDEWTHLLPSRLFEPLRLPALLERALEAEALIRVEEYQKGDELIVRAEVPGVDVDKDVDITVSDHRLHIEAQRREEEQSERKGFVHRELRYGRFVRDLQLPEGVTESDVSATYTDGILEIRVHVPQGTPPTRIPITTA